MQPIEETLRARLRNRTAVRHEMQIVTFVRINIPRGHSGSCDSLGLNRATRRGARRSPK